MTGIIIMEDGDRAFLHRMIDEARPGTIVEMRQEPASEAARKRMWAMLNEVAEKVPHRTMDGGERFYAAEQWKLLFLHACGQEVEMMPSLDGSTFLPYEGRSSKMNTRDMAELLSCIEAFGAQNGVEFKQ